MSPKTTLGGVRVYIAVVEQAAIFEDAVPPLPGLVVSAHLAEIARAVVVTYGEGW